MKLLIAILLVTAGRQPLQRAERPSSVANALDALGLLQPESVRSILLLDSGKSILHSKADDLEADLRKDSNNIDDSLILKGYYISHVLRTDNRLRLHNIISMMISTAHSI